MGGMKRLIVVGLTVIVVLALTLVTPNAQKQTATIVFVDSQAAINAHPAGQAASDLQVQAREEVDFIRNSIEALNRRVIQGEDLPAADRERLQVLLATLDSVQLRYQEDISAAAQPAIEEVNDVIRELATGNGYAIVLDTLVAGNGLVVFAQDGLDITPLVLERIRR
jgi:outer membrane protein